MLEFLNSSNLVILNRAMIPPTEVLEG